MIIFGIDPGTLITGYGVIEYLDNRIRLLGYGAIRPSRKKGLPYEKRLLQIAEGIAERLETFSPDVVALEDAFFGKSVQSALRIGEARGMVLITAARCGIPVYQYPPASVKKAIVGHGNAVKQRVQEMVKRMLHVEEELIPPDSADAIAIALCHVFRGEQMRNFISDGS